MAKYVVEEPDVTIVSDKGQVVIPAYLRNKMGIKPRSKLLVYSVEDTIILKKLTLPDIRKEMQELWKEIDKKIAKYGEMSEEEIQAVIEKHRKEKRNRSKGA
ncbi:MAG: AbrB/MazE/SpoVT family DNA-binding domain-containing protein [Thaumarchaeota archaeon]|nr:AbrB/MazE/SpoVT family DNA-binding domain-containing protein [Nitrososphaerota archaeon]